MITNSDRNAPNAAGEPRTAQAPKAPSAAAQPVLSLATEPPKSAKDARNPDPYNTSGSFDRTKNWARVGKR